MNRSAKWLLIVTTDLDGFSLVNCRQLAKFTKILPTKFSQYIVHSFIMICGQNILVVAWFDENDNNFPCKGMCVFG